MVEKTKMVQGKGSGPKVYQSILDGWLSPNPKSEERGRLFVVGLRYGL
jgi:hypothetical protein